jgi:hypothetical protein
MDFHPLADIFPALIEGAEFDALVEDIGAHGLHEPIVIFEEKILDGRNRYRACTRGGVEPLFEPFRGDDPVAYVISRNLRRRHLDESQRAMVAAKLATLKRGDNQHSPIGETSQAEAAELLNVGKRSVERAAEVRDHGASELVNAVERGAVSVSAAADVATMPIEEQREIVARGEREILEAAKAIRGRKVQARRAERIAKLCVMSNSNAPLPQDRRYPILLADPPGRSIVMVLTRVCPAPQIVTIRRWRRRTSASFRFQTWPLSMPYCSCGQLGRTCPKRSRCWPRGALNTSPTPFGLRTSLVLGVGCGTSMRR